MYIQDNFDLKRAYESLLFVNSVVKQYGQSEKTVAYIKELKSAIRDYHNRPVTHHIIAGMYDWYLELIDVPQNIKDPDAWFDEEERLYALPSQYDCTGQKFTITYRVVKRTDGYHIYHYVGLDL